jgi:Raf kinase inhibitor-like YbhB/YbcL family protein
MSFRLSSNDLKDGQRMPEAQVFNGMGYTGGNRSPHLAWDGAPAGTQSFVVTCYDPDAPTGSGWWHWVVMNVPASAKELLSGAGSGKGLPSGAVQTRTDFGNPDTAGPRRRQDLFTITSLQCTP